MVTFGRKREAILSAFSDSSLWRNQATRGLREMAIFLGQSRNAKRGLNSAARLLNVA